MDGADAAWIADGILRGCRDQFDPALERLATSGDAARHPFPQPLRGRAGCDFSFSGLKTAVAQRSARMQPLAEADRADIAAGFQRGVAEVLALLKHPLFRLGGAHGTLKRAIEVLELAVLRGTRPQAGSGGLISDFDRFRSELGKLRKQEASSLHASEQRAKLKDEELDLAQSLIVSLQKALAPLESVAASKPFDFAELAQRHYEVLIALSCDQNGVAVVFEGSQGSALAAAFDDLLGEQKPSGLMVQLGDYPEVFQTAFADRMVRRPEHANAHLQIYGQLEARLTETDRVILGGLVEGVWPPAPRVDPWLSRPMRHELGLDVPERRIGLSAHDFAQLLGTGEVILTHAAKVGGAPAVASRFLHRLEAVAGEATAQTRFEDFVIEQVRGGRGIFGLYPPTDPATDGQFKAWCANREKTR